MLSALVMRKRWRKIGLGTTLKQPLVVSSRYKVEPSDLVLDLVASNSDATSRTQLPQPVVKLEPRTIDLTMSDADTTSRPQSPQPVVIIDLTMSDAGDDTTPAPVRNKRTHSSRSSSSPSIPSSLSPDGTDKSSDDSPLPAWPADLYVVDIVQGFEKCEEACRGRRSVEKAFVRHFKVPFRHTTFYNHPRHWDNTLAAIRNEALRAGHTSAGLWTTFLDRARTAKPVHKRKKKKKKI